MNKTTLAFCLILSAPAVFSQPASFSTSSGILEIPAMTINGGTAFSRVELQLSDVASGEFTLVSFERNPAPDNTVQEQVLEFGDSVSLRENQVLQFIGVVAESRCPSDVVCITAGEVTVLLRFRDALPGGESIRTDIGLTLGGTDISWHEHNGVYFRLAQVSPYPVSTEEFVEADYEIRLEYSSVPFK